MLGKLEIYSTNVENEKKKQAKRWYQDRHRVDGDNTNEQNPTQTLNGESTFVMNEELYAKKRRLAIKYGNDLQTVRARRSPLRKGSLK